MRRIIVSYESILPLTCEELVEMDEFDRKTLAMVAILTANRRGPAEAFILSLILIQATYQDLTPELVQEDVEEFRENFDCAVEDARRIASR